MSSVLPAAALDYTLPEDRIATEPAEPRDAARLMVVWKQDAAHVEHRAVRDLPEYLRADDLLVVNSSTVVRARLVGVRSDTSGRAEGLFLGLAPAQVHADRPAAVWRLMLRSRRPRPGGRIDLHDRSGALSGAWLELLAKGEGPGASGEEDSSWSAAVWFGDSPLDPSPAASFDLLERIGRTPLPPYILAARKRSSPDAPPDAPGREAADHDHYQTVYADASQPGSVAAPTAGLHFTPNLLRQLEASGVRRHTVVLHVGAGTFKPVQTEFVQQHPMHSEWCVLPASTARAITAARASGGRVFAVGTTSARTLESFSAQQIALAASENRDLSAETRLLIAPGHRWQNLDGLLTNFHLPRSTLLALVGAVLPEGLPRLLGHYRQAIDAGYRFFSYGDAMLILP